MQSHEAIEKAIGHKTRKHAKRLGLSISMVHKWQEPHSDFTDSGARNPLDRIEQIIETSISLGGSENDSLAPLFYLSGRFGFSCIKLMDTKPPSAKKLQMELVRTIEEFGKLMTEAAGDLEDGKIDPTEAKRIKEKGNQVIRQILTLIILAKRAADNEG